MQNWIWKVSGYYHSGKLAVETVHTSDMSKDMEVAAFNSRGDIGKVTVTDLTAIDIGGRGY